MWKQIRPLLDDPTRPFVHRDYSWLHFNDRVLAEARNENNPLLERLKFLGITSSNLDEFFMIRVASMQAEINQLLRQQKPDTKRLNRLKSIRAEILRSCDRFHRRQNVIFNQLRKS